ncbi:aldo/keto reductase [Humibacter sp.]|uniref:aldo/keto reductase n=1 Tax=Humibacter sp. TaxID=1940291 RepID=UPI002BCC20DD|nr:aldo/keto reductase [Humibacter sp.]HVX06733.1 aldo/keto reductase [Humibacter sp.]
MSEIREFPRVGFGTAGIARPRSDAELSASPVSEAEGMATLATAWDEGLRWFDTAPFYGQGRAERMLGAFLRGRPRGEYLLTTKVGRIIRDGAAIFDFSADGIRRSLDASLRRLGVDRVDVILLHDPDDHLNQAVAESWPTMQSLRNESIVGGIGIGVTRLTTATTLIERIDPAMLLLAERYSLLDPSAADRLLPLCQRRGIDVVIAGAAG